MAAAMRSARSNYKLCLRQKCVAEHLQFTNDLHEALLQKDVQSFWKSWNANLVIVLNPRYLMVSVIKGKLPSFFYRAMHFSAKRGLVIACRPSVLSVCDVGDL